MKQSKRAMRFDTVRDYDLRERIKIATQNMEKQRRADSPGKAGAQKSGAAAARERMIARQTGTGHEEEFDPIREYEKELAGASQEPLTPGRAYELFTKGSGAAAARARMIARQQKQGRA